MFRNVEICAASVSDNGDDKPDKIYTVTRLVDNAEEISSRLDHEREEISERNKLVNMLSQHRHRLRTILHHLCRMLHL